MSETLNKADLAAQVATLMNTTNKYGLEAVKAVFNALHAVLAKGQPVNVSDFGKFDVRQTEARQGRNPKTGETVEIPPKAVVKFKPGKLLKESVNGGPMPF